MNVYSVLEFTENAVSATNHCHWLPSLPQCKTLVEYAISEIYKKSPGEQRTAILRQFTSIIEAIVGARGKEVLGGVIDQVRKLKERTEFSMNSDDMKKNRAIQQLLKALDGKFPGGWSTIVFKLNFRDQVRF